MRKENKNNKRSVLFQDTNRVALEFNYEAKRGLNLNELYLLRKLLLNLIRRLMRTLGRKRGESSSRDPGSNIGYHSSLVTMHAMLA